MNDLDYEYSAPLTVGGPTATYDLRAPFPQYAEVAILSVVFTDTGYIFVSPDASPETLSQTVNLGGGGVRGAAFNGTTNFHVTPVAVFWPLDHDQMVHVSVSVTGSHAGLVTLIFRRPRISPTPFQPYEVTPELEQTYNRTYEAAVLEQAKRGRN